MSTFDSNLTQELFKSLVRYDQETGIFTRLSTKRTDRIGATVGYKSGKGYLQIRVNGKAYASHRLAWLYVHGAWPVGQIDHINGIRDDNRIVNLRDVSGSVNQQNRRRAQSTSTSGLFGALKCTARPQRPWTASIRVDGKVKTLGSYKTAEDAHAAYIQAKTQYHQGFVKLLEQQ